MRSCMTDWVHKSYFVPRLQVLQETRDVGGLGGPEEPPLGSSGGTPKLQSSQPTLTREGPLGPCGSPPLVILTVGQGFSLASSVAIA